MTFVQPDANFAVEYGDGRRNNTAVANDPLKLIGPSLCFAGTEDREQ
jgi:hypothetical protein